MALHSLRLWLIAGASATILASPAAALDGQDLLKKINAAYKLQGIEILAKSVVVNGDDVTLTEAGVSMSETDNGAIPLGDIELEGVSEVNGGYKITAVNFEDIDFVDGETRLVATDIAIENLIIPAVATGAGLDGIMLYEQAVASDIELYSGETRFLYVDNIFSSMNLDKATGTVSGRFELNEFSVDVTDVSDEATQKTLNELQMEILSGTFTTGGTWNTKTGDLDFDDFKLSIDNVGTLSASFGVNGYTMELVEGLQELAKEQAANASDPDAASMAGLAALGLAQEMGIKNALIKFEDDSITERLIDYMAKEQGVSAQEFTTMIKAVVPMYTSQMGMPSLQAAIVSAVNTYLDDPQTISISAKPKAPVKGPEILGTMMGDPNALTDVLGVTVQAND